MPHKKAKRTVRERVRDETGSDHAPKDSSSLRNEAIPKSASRILNASSIRQEYRKRKLRDGEDTGQTNKRQKNSDGTKKDIIFKIQPGESMQHFARRVEDDMRPVIKSATESARATARKAVRDERDAYLAKKKQKKALKDGIQSDEKEDRPKSPLPPSKTNVPLHVSERDGKKEFATASSSAPRRLNDIAQAPPEFKKLPRGATNVHSKKTDVLSMSQKVMMEEERTKAIARYRQLKVNRKALAEGSP